MTGYKLYYFELRARGEICRLSFKAAKIDFEDIRLNREEWIKEKASGRPPLGQMPFIVTPEGKYLAQSGAIMRYICKKGGLSPSDEFDEAEADMIVDSTHDLRAKLIRIRFESDPDKKENLIKDFYDNELPARLGGYKAVLKDKDFLVGDKLTYADIALFELLNSFLADGEPVVPKQLEKFPLLVEYYKRVLSVPQINDWVVNRDKCSLFP